MTTRVSIMLDITYDDQGVPAEDLRRFARQVIEDGMYTGCFTKDTMATIESYQLGIGVIPDHLLAAAEVRDTPEAKPGGYNDSLEADQQITSEERIAAYLFEGYRDAFSEFDAAEAGREILQMILREYRPDLLG